MLETYPAILRDNRIEWSGEAPDLPLGAGVRVHITLLEKTAQAGTSSSGQLMAAALERMAASQSLRNIVDAAAWERELRQENPLSGREP